VVHFGMDLLDSVMPYIKQISLEEATGFLKKLLDEAIERAGRVWHIVHVTSLKPRAMEVLWNDHVRPLTADSLAAGDACRGDLSRQ
jgi:hypothetical protein